MDYVCHYSGELNGNRLHLYVRNARALFVCNVQLRELMISMSSKEEKREFQTGKKERNTNEFSRTPSSSLVEKSVLEKDRTVRK